MVSPVPPQNTHVRGHRSLRSCQMPEGHDAEATQPTKPAKGEPIEVPVPKKGDVLGFLERIAKTPDLEREKNNN